MDAKRQEIEQTPRQTTGRLEADRTKLVDAIALFRASARTDRDMTDEAVVKWAHGNGSTARDASMVRNAWHDFEQGRRYGGLEVWPYKMDYTQPSESPRHHMVDDEEHRAGRPTGRDLDTFKDDATGEWVTEGELDRRRTARAAETKREREPAESSAARAHPEPPQRRGPATALDAPDDEEVLY